MSVSPIGTGPASTSRGFFRAKWRTVLPRLRLHLGFLAEGRALTAAVLAILVLLFFLGSLVRVHHFKGRVDFDPNDETGFFWTESAIQYRYAKMAGEGRAIPDFDPLAQYPEGLRVWEQETPVMEYLDGSLYRIFGGGMPFHVFLIYVISFTSCLGIFAAYGTAKNLWQDRRAGLLAAALYTVAFATFSRILNAYPREHLAQPLLFFGLWALLAAMRRRGTGTAAGPLVRQERLLALMAGTALGAGLVSWHLSRFFLLIVSCCLGAVWIYLLVTDEQGSSRLARIIGWLMVPLIGASLLSPLLRSQLFFLSPGVAILASIPLASHLGNRLSPGKQFGLWLVIVLLLAGGAAAATLGKEEAYSHVWALMKAKILHFGIKPADPLRLPYEARFIWIEDLRGPDPGIFLFSYGTIPILAFLGLLFGYAGRPWREWGSQKTFWILLFLIFMILYLLLQRMTGFFIFFLVVLAGGVMIRRHVVILLLVLVCGGFETYKFITYGQPTFHAALVDSLFTPRTPVVPNWRQNDLAFINWIRRYTRPGDVFLAKLGTSPAILAYADRPVVIQSKLEHRLGREKTEAFILALYRSEEEFFRFSRANQAGYFVYEAPLVLDAGGDSDRYTAGHLKLRRDSAAYLFHFHPERLKHFTLLFQNSFYRIYAVRPPGKGTFDSLPYQPTYDSSLFGPEEGEFFNDAATPAVMARLDTAVQLYTQAQAHMNAGRVNDAIWYFQTAMRYNHGIMGLHTELGLAYVRTGRTEEGMHHLREELRNYPDYVWGHYNLGYVLAGMGRYDEALKEWNSALLLDPNNEAILDSIRRVSRLLDVMSGRK